MFNGLFSPQTGVLTPSGPGWVRQLLRTCGVLATLILVQILGLEAFAQPVPLSLEHRRALTVESIEVAGNQSTNSGLIIALMDLHPGALINDDDLDLARLRLLNTGYFSSVELSLKKGARRGQVIVQVQVTERSTLLLEEWYLGFSGVVPFWIGGSFGESNLFGRGISLSGAVLASAQVQGYRLRWYDGRLLGTAASLGVTLLYNSGQEWGQEENGARARLEYRRAGAIASTGFAFSRFTRGFMDLRVEGIEASFRGPVFINPPYILPGRSYLTSLGFTMMRDSRDDDFVPTRGSLISLSTELSTSRLASDYNFSRYFLQGAFHLSLTPRDSLGGRLHAGYVQGDAPFFNRFFIGDYSYFTLNKSSLPRVMELNTSDISVYDDVLISTSVDYHRLFHSGSRGVYRAYAYASANFAWSDSREGSVRGPQPNLTPNLAFNVPVTMDAGLKLDTEAGAFILSISYFLDLAIN
ncbi:MAG: Outer membrane protein assembly factor BamA [Myxococcota bacterium]|nr:Outer membrane protein assembly factor BamA [Myxococcota bacterium]